MKELLTDLFIVLFIAVITLGVVCANLNQRIEDLEDQIAMQNEQIIYIENAIQNQED